jgi:2-methylcitrate dehydratase PrpD
MTTSVTERLAEWIAKATYDEIPDVGIRRVEERFIDSLGVQVAGLSVRAGQIITQWVKGQGGTPESSGQLGEVKLESKVVVTLKDGTESEGTAHQSHGNPRDPLTEAEVAAKFHECTEALVSEERRAVVIDLCYQLDSLPSVRALGDAVCSTSS